MKKNIFNFLKIIFEINSDYNSIGSGGWLNFLEYDIRYLELYFKKPKYNLNDQINEA